MSTLSRAGAAIVRAWWQQVLSTSAVVWIAIGMILVAMASTFVIVPWWEAPEPFRTRLLHDLAGMPQALLAAAWFSIASTIVRQNEPRTARLVPGHPAALRVCLAACALGVTAASTAISAATHWPVLPAALFAFAVAAVIAMSARVIWIGALAILPLLVPSVRRATLAGLEAIWQAAPIVLAFLVVAAAGFALWRVVMDGDERHVRRHKRQLAYAAAMTGRFMVVGAQSRLPWWKGWLTERPYTIWMRHQLSRSGTSAKSRLILGMGPTAHWTMVATYGLLCLGLVMVFLVAAAKDPDRRKFDGLWFLVAANSVVTSAYFSMAMWRSRREQALLRLLPGAPKAASINRWLARHYAVQYVATAVVTALVLFALRGLFEPTASDQQIALSVLALCPLGPIVSWRDWTRMKAPTSNLTLRDGVTVVGTYAVAISSAAWGHAPWWVLGTLAVVLSVPLGWWRLQAIARAPAAWPVGRANCS